MVRIIMKKLSIATLILCLLLTSCASNKTETLIEGETDVAANQTIGTSHTAAPTADPVEVKLESMTLEEKVWQMFLVAPEDIIDADSVTVAGEMTKAAIESCPVGGFIMFSNNINERQQIIDMISGMQSYSKIPLFIAVDEEGGRVARLGKADVGVTQFPPMAEVGARGNTE